MRKFRSFMQAVSPPPSSYHAVFSHLHLTTAVRSAIIKIQITISPQKGITVMAKIDVLTESFKMKSEKFAIGCQSYEELGQWDTENDGPMSSYYRQELIGIALRILAADGVITQKEADYANRCFSFEYTKEEYEAFYELTEDLILDESFSEDFSNGITKLKAVNEKLAAAYKELLTNMLEIIIASDGHIAENEIAEAKKLRALCG